MYLFFSARSADFTPPPLWHQHHDLYITTTTTDYLLPPPNTMSLLPPPEALYPDPTTALSAIQLHAKQHGYAFIKRSSKATRVIFACDRGGQYDSRCKDLRAHDSKQRQSGSKKCGCLMQVELRRDSISGQWILRVLEGAHNHGPSAAAVAHPSHRSAALTPDIRAQIGIFVRAGQSISQILTNLRISHPGIPLIAKDISNIVQQIRAEELNGKTPIQWLLEVSIEYIQDSFTNLYYTLGASKH
jgi:FAR1 DNA-binding domain